jgi:putative transposase
LAVVVTGADVQDRDGAKLVIGKMQHCILRLRLIWADAAYRGPLLFGWVWALRAYHKIKLEIVRGLDGQEGFVVQRKRWIVERTFGWFNRYRRLSKDYEFLTKSSEAMLYASMSHLMVRRLARKFRKARYGMDH